MKIHTVWIQRACRYPGQFTPELVAAMDKNGYEDNPDYIEGELRKFQAVAADLDRDEIESAEHIVLSIPLDYNAISRLLERTSTLEMQGAEAWKSG